MTPATSQRLVAAFVLLVLAALTAWIIHSTEWIEADESLPMKGEARRNSLYAARELARALGAGAQTPLGFDQMPPAGATLVLTSDEWNFLPERQQQLKAWVDAGGHLLTTGCYSTVLLELGDWIGVSCAATPVKSAGKGDADKSSTDAGDADGAHSMNDDADDADGDAAERAAEPESPSTQEAPTAGKSTRDASKDAHAAAKAPATAPATKPLREAKRRPACHALLEHRPRTPAIAGRQSYTLCAWSGPNSSRNRLIAARAPAVQWQLDGEHGAEIIRVGVGRGAVTVAAAAHWFDNRTLGVGDNALIYVAAAQVQSGATIWLIAREDADNLIALIWRNAAVAVLLGVAALALALWRGALRFGPLRSTPPAARRSLAEQIRGTGEFILRAGGGQALLQAQWRALETIALRRVPGFAPLDRADRVEQIARATGIELARLRAAVERAANRETTSLRRADVELAAATLETARRRLAARASVPMPDAAP